MSELVTQPIIQYGFLGFAAVQLAVMVWMVRRLLTLLADSNRIIEANTEAIRTVRGLTKELLELDRSIHDKLLARPCIAAGEGG